MAALLVSLSIMAVMLTVAMPVWKQEAQREKEAELMFRGMQYARAIGLFQRKYANAFPPSFDVLVEQRFLRKKYKDPITGQDFQAVTQLGSNAPGAGGGAASRPGQTPGATTAPGQSTGIPVSSPTAGGGGSATVGGIIGVTSKSKDRSIRIYNGRTHYNEWQFVYTPATQQPGAAGVPGAGGPGGATRPGQTPSTPGAGGVPGAPGGTRPATPGGPPGQGPGRSGSPFGQPQGAPPIRR